jgi:NADPH-dependent 2,4-dienoyl-CoA reductase/sulfur reductase-like enzyme
LRNRRIVIIGGGIAGLTAAASARQVDKNSEIVVLSKEPYLPYRRSSLPSIIVRGTLGAENPFIFHSWINELNVRLLLGVEALDVDPDERVVRAKNIKTQESLSFSYDALVLATGGSPAIKVEGCARKRGVFSFRTLEDALEVSRYAQAGGSAVVVGAGFIGLKVAEALMKRKMKVTIVELYRVLRGLVEPSLSSYLKGLIEQRGVEVLTGVTIEEVGGREKVEYVKLSDDRKIPASLVVFAAGVAPNVDLARKARVELGTTGAIRVNRYMCTSVPEIYAAGDCVETRDFLTGNWTYVPLGSFAAKEGAVAGANAAGAQEEMKEIIRTQIETIFANEVASIGHTSETAKRMGVSTNVMELPIIERRSTLLRTYPSKLLVITDARGRVIGAQIISRRFASMLAFHLLSAIEKRLALEELLEKWSPSIPLYIDFLLGKTLSSQPSLEVHT